MSQVIEGRKKVTAEVVSLPANLHDLVQRTAAPRDCRQKLDRLGIAEAPPLLPTSSTSPFRVALIRIRSARAQSFFGFCSSSPRKVRSPTKTNGTR